MCHIVSLLAAAIVTAAAGGCDPAEQSSDRLRLDFVRSDWTGDPAIDTRVPEGLPSAATIETTAPDLIPSECDRWAGWVSPEMGAADYFCPLEDGTELFVQIVAEAPGAEPGSVEARIHLTRPLPTGGREWISTSWYDGTWEKVPGLRESLTWTWP